MRGIWAIVMVMMTLTVSAQRVNTRLPGKLVPIERPDTVAPVDTISVTAAELPLSGYDKPLRATHETFFVTNHTNRHINTLIVNIDYLDMQGRVIHSRRAMVYPDVPHGATRRVNLRTWDRQNTYYYADGPQPRTQNVTPFRVRITPIAILAPRR